MLVCVTGIDGAGKSTITAGLVDWIAARGLAVRSVKISLFDNPAYNRYRQTLAWMKQSQPEIEKVLRAALVTLETCRTIREETVSALEAGEIVICDRYIEASACYLKARDLPEKEFIAVSEQLPVPDLAVLLDLPVADSVRRLTALGEHPEPKQVSFLARMHRLLMTWASNAGAIILDACLPPEELITVIGQRILAARGESR